MAPTVVSAQDSTSQQQRPAPEAQEADSITPPLLANRTHAVRTGDTLWDLARSYLGDPFLWPEIYRLNTDVVEDPHWIYPGENLRVPGDDGAADEPQVAASEEPAPTSFGPMTSSTRMMRRSIGDTPRRRMTLGRTEAPVIRPGEYYAAPWVERSGGPRGAGTIIMGADITAAAQSERDRLNLQDRILIVPPRNESASRGSRYLAYELGPEISGRGQVVVPTGVVVVEAGSDRREALHARVLSEYGALRVGQHLIRIDSVTFPTSRPAPVELGALKAKVVWVRGENVLPSLHEYVVLDRSTRDGVKQGDQFTLIRRRGRGDAGIALPAETIAVLQVIRVTPFGTTAMVVDHQQPAIEMGNEARLSAKMP